MGMVSNKHDQSTLDPPLLLCPTLEVELLNPIIFSRVFNIVPKPSSSEKTPS
jgi:hypothetical protein